MSEKMSDQDIQRYLDLATDDLQAAIDNLQIGHVRVAISRAYYAMFYASTAFLGSRGIWRSKHQGVIAAFGEYLVKPGLIEARYGRNLNEAFHARLDSDYVPYPVADVQTAQQLVEKAQDFVQRIHQTLEETNPETESGDDAVK